MDKECGELNLEYKRSDKPHWIIRRVGICHMREHANFQQTVNSPNLKSQIFTDMERAICRVYHLPCNLLSDF